MDVFRLRAQERSDASAVAKLLLRPAILRQTMVFSPYTSEEEARDVLEKPGDGLAIVAADANTGAVIGHVVLSRNRRSRAHSASFGIAIHEDWQRRGVGSALMAAMIETAERWLGLTRITLWVFVDNDPAIKLYRRYGFEIEGTLRKEHLRDGSYADVHLMARLSDSLDETRCR